MRRLSQTALMPKRRAGILTVLDEYDGFHLNNPGRNMPLDLFMRFHFLKHKNEFGAEARTQMVEMIYTLERYKGYLNAISGRKQSGSPDSITWASRFKAF